MTFGRLVVAWLPVAALYCLAPPIGYQWNHPAEQQQPLPLHPNGWECGWRFAEAGVLTLFAALWFDSLGSGGWWLLFALLGLLAAFPRRLVMWQHVDLPRRRHLLIHGIADVARYVVAGGLLAWLLS